jgi:predicted dehydrogenase
VNLLGRTGREKLPALAIAEFGEVKAAWRSFGGQLIVGFTHRWSAAVRIVRAALDQVRSPKFLVYRVATGPVRGGHWCTDRRQGGRLYGEVCHFTATAQAE